jgi:hypothetical protein
MFAASLRFSGPAKRTLGPGCLAVRLYEMQSGRTVARAEILHTPLVTLKPSQQMSSIVVCTLPL